MDDTRIVPRSSTPVYVVTFLSFGTGTPRRRNTSLYPLFVSFIKEKIFYLTCLSFFRPFSLPFPPSRYTSLIDNTSRDNQKLSLWCFRGDSTPTPALHVLPSAGPTVCGPPVTGLFLLTGSVSGTRFPPEGHRLPSVPPLSSPWRHDLRSPMGPPVVPRETKVSDRTGSQNGPSTL